MTSITGKVFRGSGKAEKFLAMDNYHEFLAGIFGEEPFPGTLNLRVNSSRLEKLKQGLNSKRLEAFEKDGRDFGGITAYPVNVEYEKALLLEIDRTHYGGNVAEIVAPENLREELNLEDGDEVELSSRSF